MTDYKGAFYTNHQCGCFWEFHPSSIFGHTLLEIAQVTDDTVITIVRQEETPRQPTKVVTLAWSKLMYVCHGIICTPYNQLVVYPHPGWLPTKVVFTKFSLVCDCMVQREVFLCDMIQNAGFTKVPEWHQLVW